MANGVVRTFTMVFFLATVCTGFADCSFKALQVTYKVSPCPPENFNWPQLKKSDGSKKEIEKMPLLGGGRIECSKLFRYRIKMNTDHTETSPTLDAYLGLLKNGSSCHLLIGIPTVGPNTDDSDLIRNAGEMMKGVPELAFQDTRYSIVPKSEKVEIIGGRDEAVEWCKKLPLPELVNTKE